MKIRMLWASALVLMMSGLGYCNYPGDCNGDRMVDDLDFLLVIGNFGSTDPALKLLGDCNGDGETNDLDFLLVITNFATDARNNFTGEMINIPAGSFQMGNNGHEGYNSFPEEFPQHWVTLSGYWIGKYEVTRREYRQFINAGGYANRVYWSTAGWGWKGSRTQPAYWAAKQYWNFESFTQTESHPVVGVSYYEAEAFCNWAGGHLPTEAQWEKAARWDSLNQYPNVYPWGDSWDYQRCNNWNDNLYQGSQTAPVGSYASGASPYGCMDMTGNVWEWCQDWYKSYPGSSSPFDYTNTYRVLRGGSWYSYYSNFYYRAAFRHSIGFDPYDYWTYGGFRFSR